MWSSGGCRSHGRPHTDAQIRDLEVFPAHLGVPGPDLRGDGRRRPVEAQARVGPGRRAGPLQCARLEAPQAVAGRRGAPRRRHQRHLHGQPPTSRVAQRRRGADHRHRPAGDRPRPGGAGADQMELVDMAPEALRRRLAHGNIYPPERIDAALSNYFRTGNLTALRELALLWVADRVEEGLSDYRERHDIAGPWETKERVVVSLTGPTASRLIRRAARMAMRTKAELVGVHVRTDDGLTQRDRSWSRPSQPARRAGRAVRGVVGHRCGAGAVSRWPGPRTPPSWSWGPPIAAGLNEFRPRLGHRLGDPGRRRLRWTSTSSPPRRRCTRCRARRGRPLTDGTRHGSGHAATPAPVRHHQLLPHSRFGVGWRPWSSGWWGSRSCTLLLTADRSGHSLATALSSYLVLVVVVAATGGVWPAVAGRLRRIPPVQLLLRPADPHLHHRRCP